MISHIRTGAGNQKPNAGKKMQFRLIDISIGKGYLVRELRQQWSETVYERDQPSKSRAGVLKTLC